MSRKLILVVEDDTGIARVSKRFLSRLGYQVEITGSGGSALEWLQYNNVDLLVLDYSLPDMTSDKLLDELEARDQKFPFIVITGFGNEQLAVDLMKRGALDYVIKDDNFWDVFVKAVAQSLDHTATAKRLDDAERALKMSEERFRSLFENTPVSIWEYDYSAVKEYIDQLETPANISFQEYLDEHGAVVRGCLKRVEILGVNRASLKLFRANNKQALLANIRRFITKDTYAVFKRGLVAIYNGEEMLEMEMEIRISDGTKRNVVFNWCVPPGFESTYSRVLVSIVDITERKRAEDALKAERALLALRVEERTAALKSANEELARAAKLKDEFLASMSHELRTPLNTILGLSESLNEDVYGPLNSSQRKSINSIEESGDHLLALINDILDLSKIGVGALELEYAPVYVQTMCNDSLRFIKQLAQKKRLKIKLHIAHQISVIHCDELRMKQILVNLLSNAVKFTPEGGSIGLEVTSGTDVDTVLFTVWDTGIGIAQENINRLFQPFVQLDSRLSRKYSGTGLGLSLVYRLTELHNGGVSVESEFGRGSKFTVAIPIGEPQALAEQEIQTLPNKQSNDTPRRSPIVNGAASRTIMIVEDNEKNIKTLSDFLRASNYRLSIAKTGIEAIAKAHDELPDLILMDIQMPEMDGYETISRIRIDQDLQNIPIIAVTALAMAGDKERCLAAGANAYMSKPLSLKKLTLMLEEYLS